MVFRTMPGLVSASLFRAFAVWAMPASTQIPNRPIRIVVPFVPGGTSDIAGRILAAGAAPSLPAGGFLAPAGTPLATVGALTAAFNKALDDPLLRQRLQEAAAVPRGGPPSRMAAHLGHEAARWGAVIRANPISAE